jgi:hypothetical protein
MTTWCTPADLLADVADVELLAGLAGPTDQPPVPGALLRAVIEEADYVSEWLPDEQAAATAAAARLALACLRAGELVEGYLSARWPGGLDPVPGLVRGCAVALAGEELVGTRSAPPESPYAGILRRARACHDVLRGLRDGTLTLGQAVAPASAPAVRWHSAPRLTDMDSLAAL